MTRDEIAEYWLRSSDEDLDVMNSLAEKGHYSWALFMGHLVLEKILKAVYVQTVDSNVPRTHDLVQLAMASGLKMTDLQKDLLDEITTFNIKARYPDYKNRFRIKATQEFASGYLDKIKEMRIWLKNLIELH